MPKGPVPTDLNAFILEHDEAVLEVTRAQSRVATLERQIDEKRAEQGLEPLYASTEDSDEDDTPDEAKGFGKRQGKRQGKRRQARSGTTTEDSDEDDTESTDPTDSEEEDT